MLHILMANDTPIAVFDSESEVSAACLEYNAVTNSGARVGDYGLQRRIYWHSKPVKSWPAARSDIEQVVATCTARRGAGLCIHCDNATEKGERVCTQCLAAIKSVHQRLADKQQATTNKAH